MHVLQALWYASPVLSLCVLHRLWRERLRSITYEGFAIMLVVGIARDVVLMNAPFESRLYSQLWAATLPLALVSQAVAALGTYAAIARLYPKLGRFGVGVFLGALVLTAVASCIVVPFETRRMTGGETMLRTLFALDRWIHTLIAGALLLAVAFLARYPRPLKRMPRNLVVHTWLLSAFFSVYAVLPFVLNLVPLGGAPAAQAIASLLVLAICVGWIFGLSAEGEATEPWPAVDEGIGALIERRNERALQLGEELAKRALRQAAGRQ